MNEKRKILIAADEGISIRSFSDISDAISACLGGAGLILTEDDLGRDFFELRTGLAGEALQKVVNYRVRVALVLPDPTVYGERFSELAYEHSTHNQIRFVRSMEEAKAWLQA